MSSKKDISYKMIDAFYINDIQRKWALGILLGNALDFFKNSILLNNIKSFYDDYIFKCNFRGPELGVTLNS